MADGRLFHFPRADGATLLWASLVACALVAAALLAEAWRRRREVRRRLAEEWRAVRGIVEEKELSGPEWSLLEGTIKRWSPEAPLRCITAREHFDRLVSQDLRDARASAGEAGYAERGVLLRDIRTRLALDYVPFGQRIDSTRELYREQVLWGTADPETADWHRMTVAAVDEAHVRLRPGNQELAARFAPGQVIHFRMWREEDARYAFNAPVASIDAAQQHLLMHHTEQLERLQDRAYFRLALELPVELEVMPASDQPPATTAQPPLFRLRGRLSNLSGGGFAVQVQQPVPQQAQLRIHLSLDGQEQLVAGARLVAVVVLSGNHHLVRACFVGINEEARERIAHFIFRRQQQAKLAGLSAE